MSWGEIIIVLMVGLSAVLTLFAIFNIEETKTNMSILSDAVAKITEDLGELQGAVQRVIAKLNEPNPDIDGAVAQLGALDTGFDAMRDALNAAAPAPTPEPAPEPAPEG